MKNRTIGYIREGVVIDHIPEGKVWEIVDILRVNKTNKGIVSVGEGFSSNKIGKKGILKIEERILSEKELNKVALVAPKATISLIKNGEPIKKINAEIPDKLKNLVYCPNPNCITNDNKENEDSLVYWKNNKFRCHYCGCEFSRQEAVLNLGN